MTISVAKRSEAAIAVAIAIVVAIGVVAVVVAILLLCTRPLRNYSLRWRLQCFVIVLV